MDKNIKLHPIIGSVICLLLAGAGMIAIVGGLTAVVSVPLVFILGL